MSLTKYMLVYQKTMFDRKHVFLCINIYWTPRVVLKPEPERRGLFNIPRGLADVSVSETMFHLKT